LRQLRFLLRLLQLGFQRAPLISGKVSILLRLVVFFRPFCRLLPLDFSVRLLAGRNGGKNSQPCENR
jgi:hypothetical protein